MFDFTGFNKNIEPGFDTINDFKNSKSEIEIQYIPSNNKNDSKTVDDLPPTESKTISDHDFNVLFHSDDDNPVATHYDKAKQEFAETEKAMDEMVKSINELSEQINGLSNDISNANKKASTKKSSEEVDNVHKVFNEMIEKKKKEDPNFENKTKEIVKQVKEVIDPDKETTQETNNNAEDKKRAKYNTVYGKIRLFIENSDFIPAFLWFMENAYSNVEISHMHRRRIYKIYKEMISGSNLFAICVKDEDADTYDCEFILDGSNKAITNFMNNKRSKYAKILAKYIITSNTIPYMFQLMSFDDKASVDCFNALPTRISRIRSMSKSEVYTKTLEKICFGKDF